MSKINMSNWHVFEKCIMFEQRANAQFNNVWNMDTTIEKLWVGMILFIYLFLLLLWFGSQ